MKFQFIFYCHISLIISVINVLTASDAVCRWDVCTLSFGGAGRAFFAHALIYEFLYGSLCAPLDSLYAFSYSSGVRTRFPVQHRRNFERVPFAKYQFSHSFFFIFMWSIATLVWARLCGEHNKYTRGAKHFMDESAAGMGVEWARPLMGASGRRTVINISPWILATKMKFNSSERSKCWNL